jgi:hypothetical protein
VFRGDLAVDSNPLRAAVSIDRQYAGETPLQLKNVRSGSHVVWIQHAGYQRWTGVVQVTALKKARVNVKLQLDR